MQKIYFTTHQMLLVKSIIHTSILKIKQMQCMQMGMKLPLKYDIHYAHFAKMNSEHCQTSEMELFVKTVNDLKLLKAVITKRSTLGI